MTRPHLRQPANGDEVPVVVSSNFTAPANIKPLQRESH